MKYRNMVSQSGLEQLQKYPSTAVRNHGALLSMDNIRSSTVEFNHMPTGGIAQTVAAARLEN